MAYQHEDDLVDRVDDLELQLEVAHRPYLISCPWCSADMKSTLIVGQILHLVGCGDKKQAEINRLEGIVRELGAALESLDYRPDS